MIGRWVGAIAKTIIHAAGVAAAHRIVAGIVEQIALAALGVFADKALQLRIIVARPGVIQSARIELHPGQGVHIAVTRGRRAARAEIAEGVVGEGRLQDIGRIDQAEGRALPVMERHVGAGRAAHGRGESENPASAGHGQIIIDRVGGSAGILRRDSACE